MQDSVVPIFASVHEQMGLQVFSVTGRSKTMFKQQRIGELLWNIHLQVKISKKKY